MQRSEERIERSALLLGRNGACALQAATINRIMELDTAEQLGSGLDLVAVHQPQRHEAAAQRRHLLAIAQHRQAEAGNGNAAHLHHAPKLGDRIGKIVPDRAPRMA